MDYKNGYSLETITPRLAREYLATDEGKNRRPSKNHVQYLADSISRGEWVQITGQPIAFDKMGRLVNGQHRLLACIQANLPINVEIVRGVDDETLGDTLLRAISLLEAESTKGMSVSERIYANRKANQAYLAQA